jgi:diguanylate cyclase (GGDEF)-like protein
MVEMTGEHPVFLSDFPAQQTQYRLASAVVAVSTLAFLILAPCAKVPLAPLPAFIPIYQSAQIINDLITAVFLLGQRQFSRQNALRLLAGGYPFAALMKAAHALTFPGMFSPTGLLGAGRQTTAWLYMFWHGGFPLFVIAYSMERPEREPARRGAAPLLLTVGAVFTVVCGFVLLATADEGLLPPIMQDSHYTPAMIIVVSSVWIMNLAALISLSRRRPFSVLDLWLLVAMCAWLFDIALSAMLNAGRYDLGFYASRIYGLLAASFVLVLLLIDNSKLYLQLLHLRESDRRNAAELSRLSTVDPLTGIANRRAFDEALGQEWRRMLRHKTLLSLLMIDVDCFKQFNDTYGHVAGDQCLQAVAQALAGRARRAGELAVRYGGEEFAVLLPYMTLAEAMRVSVSDQNIPHKASTADPYVTISVGVVSLGDVPQSVGVFCRGSETNAPPAAAVLVEAADHALYRAKKAGRNRVAAVDESGIASVAA